MKKLLISLTICLSVTGCATTKISPEERSKLNQTQTQLRTDGVSIIADGCLIRSELGTSLIVGEQSRLTALKFSDLFANRLERHGIKVNQKLSPFVCGFMPEEELKKYDYQLNNQTKRAEINSFPLINSERGDLSAQQQQALLHLNQSFKKQAEQAVQNAKNKQPISKALPISDEDVAVIQALTQSRYIFMTSTTGTDASFGKKFTAGALSVGVTLATMGAGAGFVTTYIPKEGQQYIIHLIDLEKKEILWSKGGLLQGKPFSKSHHSVEVTKPLSPLFEETAE
ncbi:hypothetical protein ACF8D3_04150 [Acinetobacter sp. YQ_14]|uniref:hypothetical protein n=1 Tax=Acinetobacter sp. YQ_14 TaxID=3367236 RepID=UPI00370A9CED